MAETTGFRNGDLFCFNCGDSHKMALPMKVSKAAQLMIDFGKRHSKCNKTWEEPQPDDAATTTPEGQMDWWIRNGEHGMSSKNLFSCLSGKSIRGASTMEPADPDDFRRCYLMLKQVPALKPMLHKARSMSPVWAKIVDNWDKLSEMLEEQMKTNKANGMYEFMKELGC